MKEYLKKYQEKYKEKLKLKKAEYYQKHKEDITDKNRKNYLKNKEKILIERKIFYQNNKEEIKIYKKQYRKTHKNKINERTYKRRRIDVNFKIACNLRSRLCKAIGNNQKSGSAVRDLGCSISELKTHLESKFQDGMTWKNWGYIGWHIDHIIPLTSFDLTNREELLKACHYTNLQPLWAKENLQKSNFLQPLSINRCGGD